MVIILTLFGALLIYYIYSLLFRKIWDKGLTADIRFLQNQVTEGEKAVLTEVISNGKVFPIPILNVKFQVDKPLVFDNMENTSEGDKYYRNDVFSLLMFQKITRKIKVLCKKRGFYKINRMDLIAYNMLGRSRMYAVLKCNASLTVYPAYIDMSRILIPFHKMYGTVEAKKNLCEDPFVFRGIREYQSFDSMKSVNWMASAKTGELKVNLFDSTTEQQVVILLNLELETLLSYDELWEEEIRIAATLSELFVGKGVPTGIITNGKDIETKESISLAAGCSIHHQDYILEGLARIDTSQKFDDFIKLLEHKKTEDPNTLYILISNDKRPAMQERFHEIGRVSKGSKWILVVHPDDGFESLLSEDVICLEVPYET